MSENGDIPPEAQNIPTPDPSPTLQRYMLTLAYDGAAYHGWQKQKTPEGQWLRTVQGELENAVIAALQQPIRLVGASRTDAGVHALGQVAQFDAATRIPTARLPEAINARLAVDAEVLSAEVAHPKFDVIGGARRKQYRFRILCTQRRPLHLRKYVYRTWWKLDVARMRDAAARLRGEHDFTAFCAAGSPRLSNVRTVYHCDVETMPGVRSLTPVTAGPDALAHLAGGHAGNGGVCGASDGASGCEVVDIVISANGFLYNMVRIIAGTLLEVGRGAMPPEQVSQAMAERNRRLAGPTLPPEGLWLEWIRYE